MDTSLAIYFAGELFDHKHLIGNKILATYIERSSCNRYCAMLPQEFESSSGRAQEIRDQDLYLLLTSDLALFNFDGNDLDSGTVVEFMLAKMLDIPSVVIRSDFRNAGDQGDGEPWNLMCSFYPRTTSHIVNGMAFAQKMAKSSDNLERQIENGYQELSQALVEKLDVVKAMPSLFAGDKQKALEVYQWALNFPGETFKAKCASLDINQLIDLKHSKGLLG